MSSIKPTVKLSSRRRKDKQLTPVDQKSLNKVQANLDKLRPIKDKLIPLVSNVSGFDCMLLSNKILIYCSQEQAVTEMKQLTQRHSKYVDIKLTQPPIRRPRNKGRADKIAHK